MYTIENIMHVHVYSYCESGACASNVVYYTLQILNLSARRSDLETLTAHVYDFGWPDRLSPPLERICSICKSVDAWLNDDVRNVVVLHCRGGRSRLAVVIAAYMNYTSICARYELYCYIGIDFIE